MTTEVSSQSQSQSLIEKMHSQCNSLPSKHLGYINYTEHPSPNNYSANFINLDTDTDINIDTHSYIHNSNTLLPNFISKYINYTIDIKIPSYSLYNNENVLNRSLWGTDIYTDDSDIIAILFHSGILHSNDPFGNNNPVVSTVKNFNFNANVNDLTDNQRISDELIVRLRILPTLNKYIGKFRNNYNSRSWTNSTHDGVSISIDSIYWSRNSNTL
ncbi:Rxt3 protein [Pichia kluyveri]|uniref:Rxt3 protein n=1 Tax=Pichia kluyveri TaxID=36015 RepID=A0AAV5R170_PICKL|nr:Rxt3 protein [Pichia kluyveri]